MVRESLQYIPDDRRPSLACAAAAGLPAVPAIRHWRERPPAPAPPASRCAARGSLRAAVEVGAGADYPFGLALAADGRQLVYPAAKAGRGRRCGCRTCRPATTRALPATERRGDAVLVARRTRIGFLRRRHAPRRSISRAASMTDLADAPSGRGAAWNAAGDLVFAPVTERRADAASATASIARADTIDSRPASPRIVAGVPARRPARRLSRHVHRSRRARASGSPRSTTHRRRARGCWPPTRKPIVGRPDRVLYLNDLALMAQPLDPGPGAGRTRRRSPACRPAADRSGSSSRRHRTMC